MDQRTFSTLELHSLLDLLAGHAQTPLGRRLVAAQRPSSDRAEIELGQELTTECARYLNSGERFGFAGIEDPEAALAKLQIEGTSLEPLQILQLERLVSVGLGLREQFRGAEALELYPELSRLSGSIPDLRRLLGSIRGKILPGGEIDENASPELRAIRRELGEARTRIFRSLDSILKAQTRAVQDDLVTFRNGRFVIPIRTDARHQVPGVVHGLSSSGQTTFVEPLAAIEQNNELVRLREQEEAEIARILFSISEALRLHAAEIAAVRDAVALVDFSQAKGRLSAEFRCVRPRLAQGTALRLADVRHVLLERALRVSGATAVPITLDLDESHQVVVISGPNAGGKTVVLKTVGLAVLMAQMGLHVPACEAVLPVFDQVFADIGDQQSIAANLSTFTAHMRNIADMAERVAPPALLLLDEVGTGTDPDEGAALAVAIVDFFRRAGATTVATTHYSGLKIWAAQAEGVLNASVEFDERTLRPTYRLMVGVAGASAGLEIARRMNIPPVILDEAKARIDPAHTEAGAYLRKLKASVDDQEQLRAALEQEREAAAREYARLDLEFARREAERHREFEQELARVIAGFTAQSERLVRDLKDRVEAQRLSKAAASRSAELRRTAERLKQGPGADTGAGVPAAPTFHVADLREGTRVRIPSLGKEGVVDSTQDDTCTVLVGSLKFRLRPEEIVPLQPAAGTAAPRPGFHASGPDVNIDEEFEREANVIGMTADEATDRVDKFLDEAFVAGADTVRIIHGHGKGILRRAIAQLLKGHPQVERFALAAPEKGGGGATVVEMRK